MNATNSTRFRRFTHNTQGRDLIVGDIHGHFTKLADALGAVGFDPDAGDRLFSVGDLVDRGPESHLATTWLALPWFFAVQGNHEDMAVRWPKGHMQLGRYVQNGGGWNADSPLELQLDRAEAFAALPIAMELATSTGPVGIVHADCPLQSWPEFVAALQNPDLPRAELAHLIDMAQWSRARADNLFADNVMGVRAVVVGHTPMERMTSLGNVLFIDTRAWWGNPPLHPFTIIDAETLQPAQNPAKALQF